MDCQIRVMEILIDEYIFQLAGCNFKYIKNNAFFLLSIKNKEAGPIKKIKDFCWGHKLSFIHDWLYKYLATVLNHTRFVEFLGLWNYLWFYRLNII